MEEARLERTDYGLGPASEGWFVVNVRDAEWETNENGAAACMFESGAVSFPEIGYRLAVLQPGTTVGFYHAESNQEDFLVLGGECVLLIEGEERRLKPWDFVHCPPGTEHVFVGAGDGPCVIFMTGARTAEKSIVYPRSELALRHGAGVEKETTSPNEAYATFPKWQPGRKGPWPIPDWSARRRPSASTTPACWARAIRSARTVLARATTTG
jgi:uncharacterized cupin superfamily protein